MARIKRVCLVQGCGKFRHAHGYCNPHFLRWKRHGDPTAGGATPRPGERLQWIRDHVSYGGEDCLAWPFGRKPDGYPNVVNFDGLVTPAIRIMCTLANGDPPTPQHQAAHSCGRGREGCISPRHIRWATPVQNAEDRMKHGTQTRGRAKLEPEVVQAIYAKKGTALQTEVARELGVTNQDVWRIWNGISWRDLTGEPDDKSRARRKAIRLATRGARPVDAWDDPAA